MSGCRYFTVSRWHGRATFAIWTVNPITDAPSGERFEYVTRLAAGDKRSLKEVAEAWECCQDQGEPVPIPDKRKAVAAKQ